jgi:hypothetical protein
VLGSKKKLYINLNIYIIKEKRGTKEGDYTKTLQDKLTKSIIREVILIPSMIRPNDIGRKIPPSKSI